MKTPSQKLTVPKMGKAAKMPKPIVMKAPPMPKPVKISKLSSVKSAAVKAPRTRK
jgi:hypothetical protein